MKSTVFPKRLVAQMVLGIAERSPWLRPWLKPIGLRTWNYWSDESVRTVCLPDGQRLRVAGRNYLEFELFWKGTGYYEPITTAVLHALLGPRDTFVDVGANVGFYTLVLSAGRRGLRVAAFEPNPRNFALLRRNVQLNGFAAVRCEPMALSDRVGEAPLFLSRSAMSASLVPEFDDAMDGTAVTVGVSTLDAYLAKNPPTGRLVLKADVEGHEAAFFRGASETLERWRPDIVTEVTMPLDAASVTRFRELGYWFYPITDRGFRPAGELRPVVRGEFVFLNCLLSVKPPVRAAELFSRIAPQVQRLDLRQTSKHLTPEAREKFLRRADERVAV